MKTIFIIFTTLVLFSCASNKELPNDESKGIEQDSTQVIKDEVLQEQFTDTVEKKDDIVLVNEMKVIRKDEQDFRDVRRQIQLIEQHEKKTKLNVIDKSTQVSDVVDTTRGWIAYSVPENMKVAKSYSVKVRISRKTSGQNKAVLILGNDDAINNPEYESVATIEDVKVSGEMSAELRGDGDNFSIVALSTPTQNIDNESYTEWEWVVVPKKSGETPLKLVIKLKDLNKDIVVFNRSIKVKSNVPVAVEGFFESYWQWLMTTIIIPIFLYFWNRKRKKRQTKKS